MKEEEGKEDVEIQYSTILQKNSTKKQPEKVKETLKIRQSVNLNKSEKVIKESPRVTTSSKQANIIKASAVISEAESEKWDEVLDLESIKLQEGKGPRMQSVSSSISENTNYDLGSLMEIKLKQESKILDKPNRSTLAKEN